MDEERTGTAPGVPREIRTATAVVALEAAALLAAAGVLLDKAITGHPAKWWAPYAEIALVLLSVAVLLLCARGILRLRPAARTPIVIVQLLALPVSFDMAFQAGLVAIGGPILIAALSVLYMLFSPAARLALDRE